MPNEPKPKPGPEPDALPELVDAEVISPDHDEQLHELQASVGALIEYASGQQDLAIATKDMVGQVRDLLKEQTEHLPQFLMAEDAITEIATALRQAVATGLSHAPEGMIDVIPSDLAIDDKVTVSHLGFESPYTGHQGLVAYVPPDGEWPFVVRFHTGEFPEPGGRFPTTFRRNELLKVQPPAPLRETRQ